jgi:hypothetical protein
MVHKSWMDREELSIILPEIIDGREGATHNSVGIIDGMEEEIYDSTEIIAGRRWGGAMYNSRGNCR